MADQGFRISRTGIDVKTGADKDMVLTSKYSIFKGGFSVTGSKTLTSGVAGTVGINHNLGYIPEVQAFIKLPVQVVLLPTDRYLELPIPLVATGVEVDSYFAQSTINTLTLNLFYQDNTATYPSLTLDYQYFIFIDKGKL